MKQITIVAIILGVIVLVSSVQAFQLNDLKTKITDNQVNLKLSSNNVVASSQSTVKKAAALPSNIANLPQMVGGC